jgi:arabinose-5-phosphate isomerase
MGRFEGMSYLDRAREVFDVEMSGLKCVREQLNDAFDKAVEAILASLQKRGKVVVAGIGKSGHVGRKIAATMTSTGTTSVLLDSVDALHGDLGIINDGDVILALSYSGESGELVDLLPAFKKFSVKIIAMTGAPKSTLARSSDVVLNVKVPKEACPFNLAPTASTTAMLAMGDALAMTILEARGFKRSDFAKFHPSGAIGHALLYKVKDIMRTGARYATASESKTVKEALLAMTRAKCGSVVVTNTKGKLAGVFTDGDFRRNITQNEGVLSVVLSKVMTLNPISIREDALAIEVLKIFHERNIDDLVVINARNEPVGLVDSQDLPKFKIANA